MSVNLRCDDTFAKDEGWHEAKEKYLQFIVIIVLLLTLDYNKSIKSG